MTNRNGARMQLSRISLQLILLVELLKPAVSWWTSGSPSRTALPTPRIPPNVRLLILPGFGNDSKDYYLEDTPTGSMVASLRRRGWSDHQINVLPVQRSDWLRVFLNGVLDWKFWTATADPTRPAFAWYLNRVASSIQNLTAPTPNNEDGETGGISGTRVVVLIGHSAGGWLARAALGYGGTIVPQRQIASTLLSVEPRMQSTSSVPPVSVATEMTGTGPSPPIDLSRVLGLVTLGAPHLPPPPQVMDMTRGALRITNERYPGAYHKGNGDDVFYITVIGEAIRGVPQERKSPLEPTTVTGFAHNSYEAVCGRGDTIGDGVVPTCSAHLDDAIQLNLPGVFHSINAPERWYGSDAVLDLWHDDMIREIQQALDDPIRQGDSFQGFSERMQIPCFLNRQDKTDIGISKQS